MSDKLYSDSRGYARVPVLALTQTPAPNWLEDLNPKPNGLYSLRQATARDLAQALLQEPCRCELLQFAFDTWTTPSKASDFADQALADPSTRAFKLEGTAGAHALATVWELGHNAPVSWASHANCACYRCGETYSLVVYTPKTA